MPTTISSAPSVPDRPLPDRLDGIRRRADDATPGSWLVADGSDGAPIVYVETDSGPRALFRSAETEADAQFVSTARERMPQLINEVERLRAEITSLRAQIAQEDREQDALINERDRLHEVADNLAYAIAPVEVIGEHSSGNDPWQNALDYIATRRAVEAHAAQAGEGRKPTPCSPDGCLYEPCYRHEGEAAHAKGDHALCGDDCPAQTGGA